MLDKHESLGDTRRIDAVCDRFEEAWLSGERPSLESLLPAVPEHCRGRLFQKLLGVEIELRRRAGESPTPDEYRRKYPEFSDHIASGVTLHGEAISAGSPSLGWSMSTVSTDPCIGCPSSSQAEVAQPQDPCRSGERFGRFELLAPIGTGGFGTVWKAYDPVLKRNVALKIPRGGRVCARDRAVLLQEARAVARLRHTAVVQVYEAGEEGDAVYIASEYIEGISLRDYLAEHRMPVREVAELGVRLSEALHHAHAAKIVHRDVKPSNILLDAARMAWLTDFGLARHVDIEDGEKPSSSVLGTLAYMPPEQARGDAQAADCRADIYSLGVVLFELLTGQLPFAGEADAVRQAILRERPPRPRRLDPGIPRDMEAVCLKCLEKEPARRYESADALAVDLRRFLRGEPVIARPIAGPIRLWRWCRRTPIQAAMTVAIVLLCAVLVVGSLLHATRSLSLVRAASTNLYFHRIVAAQQSWRTNDIDYFRVLLDDCPDDLRQWEWYYLRGLLQSTRKTLKLAGGWVVYSPDGKRIATAGGEKAVKIWDADSGNLLFALRGHPSFPCAAAFSPDGDRIASAGGDDRTVMLWDLKERRRIKTLAGHQAPVVGVRFSPNGRRVVSASLDRTVRVWDAATGKELHRLVHPGRVWAADFSPDGTLIATVSGRDGSSWIQGWNSDSGTKAWELPGSGRQANLAFSPDGKRLAVADGLETVRVLDLSSQQQVLAINTNASENPHIAFHPDGSRIAANQWDNSIKIWDAVRGTEVQTIRGQTAQVQSIAFRPNSTELAFGTTHSFVFVCDATSEPGTLTLRGHQGRITAIAFSPDGDCLASCSEDGTLRTWDTQRGGAGEVLAKTTAALRGVAFSPDGSRLAAGSVDTTVQVWDRANRRGVLVFRAHTKPVQAVDFSADGKRVASAGRDRTVRIWQAATGEVLRSFTVNERDVRSVAFSPCGRWLALAGRSHQVELLRIDTGQAEFTYDCEYPAYEARFSPSGQILAITTADGAVRFWNWNTGESRVRFARKGDRRRTAIAYSPDGRRFVTASEQDALRLWDLEHERQLLILAEGADVAGIACLSPCGRYIAAVRSQDIVVWRCGP